MTRISRKRTKSWLLAPLALSLAVFATGCAPGGAPGATPGGMGGQLPLPSLDPVTAVTQQPSSNTWTPTPISVEDSVEMNNLAADAGVGGWGLPPGSGWQATFDPDRFDSGGNDPINSLSNGGALLQDFSAPTPTWDMLSSVNKRRCRRGQTQANGQSCPG